MKNEKGINNYIKNVYDVHLYSAIKYLCSLACLTDNCTSYNFKREQLFIIYKLCSLKNNIDIWKYDKDYAKLFLKENGRLSLYGYGCIDTFYTVRQFDEVRDINEKIEDDLCDESKIYPIYRIDKYDTISNESKELLTEIFREFGGYDPKILAKWIEELVIDSKSINSNNIEDNLKKLLNDNKFERKSNKIFNFIKYYKFKTNDNNLKFNVKLVCNAFEDKFISLSFEEQKELLEKLDIIDVESQIIREDSAEKEENITKETNLFKKLIRTRGKHE